MYPENNLYKYYLERFYHKDYSSKFPDKTRRITLEYMNKAINLCDKWDVCMDIGGGNGHYLAALSAKFKKAILVEIEYQPEQEELKNKFDNIEVLNSMIEEYESSEKVDFILLADIYEHIVDIGNFAKQISNLQEKGGVIYIMTPNPVFCGPATESSIYYIENKNGHVKHYSTGEISKLMQEYGYELMFLKYEETQFRQKTKIIINGLSRRDKRWSKILIYRIIRPVMIIIFSLVSKVLEIFTYKIEKKYSNDLLNTKTQNLAFKKTK